MCGVAGLLDASHRLAEDELASTTRRMTDALRHRGPDGDGLWVDAAAGVALGHRRLSIIDLSDEGRQPMHSHPDGRLVISFNGEIYNFPALRADLEQAGVAFHGHSDTEVLLAAIGRWGLDEALRRTVGMFVFALWDRQERRIHFVRDRLGKKPLYFGWVGDQLLFASELKAFFQHPDFRPRIDPGALALMLRHSCVPAPYAIFEDVFKLPPGSRLSLRLNGSNAPRGRDVLGLIERYWSALEVAEAGLAAPFTGGPDAAVEALDELLSLAVRERMISDVPLGAFLSGGIDSTTVVALMQKQSASPVKTFSIGHHQGFDESSYAREIARRLGTEHTELYVTPAETQAVIPQIPEMYDEPFADQSQIPTFLVSRLAREHVTVALSGDGGDELFGGYQRHYQARKLERLSRLPRPLRQVAGDLVMRVPQHRWDQLLGWTTHSFGFNLHKFADIVRNSDDPAAIYLRATSHWAQPEALVPGGVEPATLLNDPAPHPGLGDFASRMMALDAAAYLPDDILTKLDRASMAVALEARAPILDHRVYAFAWQLPLDLKIRRGQGKWILRRLLERYLPASLFERPKHGFGIPVGEWLRGPLRGWAEELLGDARLAQDGLLAPGPIRAVWQEHLEGRRNWGYHLWDVLMFQAWRERWLG